MAESREVRSINFVGAVLFVVGFGHIVVCQRFAKNWEIESKTVVRHNYLIFDVWLYQMPYLIEGWSVGCILG